MIEVFTEKPFFHALFHVLVRSGNHSHICLNGFTHEKGKGKKKEEESKDSSDMDEDVDPKHAAKSDDKGKNPFAKKTPVYHTFLGTPTVRQQKTSLRILMATLPQFPSTCAGRRFQ